MNSVTERVVGNFQDLPFFLHLRDCLWRDRAAVMIGAGFSLNADARPGAKQLATWKEFATHLRHALTPATSKVTAGTDNDNVPRLANEFECAFGRTTLDNLLVQNIPDTDYEPGRLHRSLVGLPWVDILTTNYDTLLERASEYTRGYDLVLVQADIATARRPRIVKLHGSFPSVRPFTFTEEDFRQYPTLFPAMVNLVQQVMLENTLCLIGFSGVDPNFLNWTGWVRDNLGNATPNIYLVNLTRISQSQRDQLRARHVVSIDLSFLADLDVGKWSSHSAKLRWFLDCLNLGKPKVNLKWPTHQEIQQKDQWLIPAGLPVRTANAKSS